MLQESGSPKQKSCLWFNDRIWRKAITLLWSGLLRESLISSIRYPSWDLEEATIRPCKISLLGGWFDRFILVFHYHLQSAPHLAVFGNRDFPFSLKPYTLYFVDAILPVRGCPSKAYFIPEDYLSRMLVCHFDSCSWCVTSEHEIRRIRRSAYRYSASCADKPA